MKKIFGLLMLCTLALTGCLDDGDSFENKWQPVMPGIQIYQLSQSQNDLALQPANAAIRLAILLAEAEKQQASTNGTTPAAADDKDSAELDLSKITVTVDKNEVNVKNSVLGTYTSIEKGTAEGDYKITYTPAYKIFGYYFNGSMTVHTGGRSLAQTTDEDPWTVTTDDLKITVQTGSFSDMIYVNGGTTELFNSDAGYIVRLTDMDLHVGARNNAPEIHSMWSGGYTVNPVKSETDPTKLSLAYSDCMGRPFSVVGSFEGDTIYSLLGDGVSTQMSYTHEPGSLYLFSGRYISGKSRAALTGYGDYNTAYYPAREVTYDYKVNLSNKTYSYTITYNGLTIES